MEPIQNPVSFQIIIVISCIAFMAILTGVMIQFSRKKTRLDRETAASLGFMEQRKPDAQFLEKVRALYQPAQSVKLSLVSQKSTPDEEIYLCDITYQDHGSDGGEKEYRTVCILSSTLQLPPFILMYQFEQVYGPAGRIINQLLTRVIAMMGMSEVDLSAHPRAASHYQAFAYDAYAVKGIFNSSLLDNLADTDGWLIRAGGDCLCFNTYETRKGKTLTRDQLSQHIRSALQAARWFSNASSI